jgi:hypothetical protein
MPGDFSRGCAIPALQSLFGGLLSAAIAGGIAIWAGWGWMVALPLALVAGASAALFWFSGGVDLWRKDTYTPVVYATPEPVQSTSSTVRVEVVNDNQIVIADLPATPAQLRDLSTGLLAGMSFSEASWSGDGRIFSKSEFHAIRQAFISRNWARWRVENAPAQGVAITAPGRAVLRELAQHEA